MSEVESFMAPMARKKTVPCHYSPNSYRVISSQAESLPNARPLMEKKTASPSNLIGQPSPPKQDLEYRHNRPNPRNVNFLRQDVRLLNEPVCNVSTISTIDQQQSWWPHRTSTEPLQVPPRTLDTTVRNDFQYKGKDVKPNGRFSAFSPNKKISKGIVPVNSLREDGGKQRFWKEGISYEHQYNCRLDPQYPTRGKRHGSFVWDRMQHPDVATDAAMYSHIPHHVADNNTQKTCHPINTGNKQFNLVGVATSDVTPTVAI